MTLLFEHIFFALYRLVVWPLMRTAFMALGLFNSKIRAGLAMRSPDKQGTLPWLKCAKNLRPIWIHCASGEFEYAKPVITRLKELSPTTPILVTYFSPSIVAAVKRFPGVDFSCPLPWETPRAQSQFITWHQPQALLIARTDTWPEMLRQAKRHHLPTLLFSATLPKNSGRARGIGRIVSRVTFGFLDHIMCVSEADKEVFKSLGAESRTEVTGDTRYDQVLARLRNPKPLKEEFFTSIPQPLLVAGSTWPEDEAVLIEVVRQLNGKVRFILVPHEPTVAHLMDLESKLLKSGLKSVRYSQVCQWPGGSILLVDQMGILAELYLKGVLAFVGGSYRKTVHSVMEPLAAGCLTFVGPLHHNNREALEFKKLGGVIEAHDATEFIAAVTKSLPKLGPSNSESAIGKILSREIQLRSGCSELVVKWCLKNIAH
jgi:3-deoxy-D-manno-octulosonic-acid transferase